MARRSLWLPSKEAIFSANSPDLVAELANSTASPLPTDVDAVFSAGAEPRSVHAVDFLLAALGRKPKDENQSVPTS
jgi:hypothetical protein